MEFSPPTDLLDDLAAYAERTSAYVTAGPGFETFRDAGEAGLPGCVRYAVPPGGRYWLGATEPIAPPEARVALARAFFEAARASGAHPALLPVGPALSAALLVHGCHRLQVGAEPIFDLFDVFAGPDPLIIHPRARALSRKGATLVEIPAADLAEGQPRRVQLEAVHAAWLGALKTPPLGFLSRSAPFELRAHKRWFALVQGDEVDAFIGALPVPAAQGWYFADLVRRPGARAGTMELLILEAMRLLAAEGFAEVRLGLAPLADLDPRERWSPASRALRWAARRRGFYDFAGNAAFKRKLQPTRWEPMYLVTPTRPTLAMLRAVARVHVPTGLLHALSVRLVQRPMAALLRDPTTDPGAPRTRPWPASTGELLRRTSITTSFVSLCLLLHVLRLTVPAVAELHRASGFVPGAPTALGLLVGPFWHNHLYHLLGDLVSFLFFGALLEMLAGRLYFALACAAGLWLSNPLTLALTSGPLHSLWPEGYANFLLEVDYGSSNAIYAFVGALAVYVRRPLWLLLPFFLNGIWVCVAKESWLAVHHEVALFAGFLGARIAARAGMRRPPLQEREPSG